MMGIFNISHSGPVQESVKITALLHHTKIRKGPGLILVPLMRDNLGIGMTHRALEQYGGAVAQVCLEVYGWLEAPSAA